MRPSKPGLVTGADAAASLLKKLGYRCETGKPLDAASVAWQDVAGEMARFSRAGKLARGTLEVVVAASAIVQEMRYREAELLAAVQAALPEQKIRRLRFRTGRVAA
jgi:predicted nucleic acid-binding Zn ribbon protein